MTTSSLESASNELHKSEANLNIMFAYLRDGVSNPAPDIYTGYKTFVDFM